MTNRKDRKGREMETDGLNVGEYVDQMALLLDLQLRDEYRDGDGLKNFCCHCCCNPRVDDW